MKQAEGSYWTVVNPVVVSGRITVKCQCGTVKEIQAATLIYGTSKSCGCKRWAERPKVSVEEKKAKQSVLKKEEYAYRRKNNLCIRCGDPKDPNSLSRCKECLLYANHDYKMRIEKKRNETK